MTISAALRSALTGLGASARSSGVIAENIANAMTPGYARRSVELASKAETGPGVQIVGIVRHSDPVIVANRRAAAAELASQDAVAEFHSELERLVGDGTDGSSLAGRLADFHASLIDAANRPEATERLETVARRASDLAQAVSGAAEGLRQLRNRADSRIGGMVDRLNTLLEDTRALNVRITAADVAGAETASLIDQRQRLIDEINEIVPVRIAERDHGQVALYSKGGAVLLDGRPARFEFSPATDTMPHMTLENGLLSGLSINGVPVRTGRERSPVAGGALAAQFRIRDELTVEAQADLDLLARDLIERFAGGGVDDTISPGSPGLFTDAGAAFDTTQVTGLSLRLEFNQAVDPARNGESWRLRAGLGASDPGEPGDGALLTRLADALSAPRLLPQDRLGAGAMTAEDVAAALTSRAVQGSQESDARLSFLSAQKLEFERLESEQGVDTDAELQNLMVVERAYAANARVVQAVETMMQALLEL
ncbi:flagellar hook-associated protein FlgK [Jhaorihella thermophila]|uniref:Flagellar hook-associated protein 1 n=1 Tax=Jhaorihella thermophila TaxID=488547 RepID=A0A1H5XJA9_9RHOB|nr:flagellar hook-associated protein FlgK [Jhaorihella thermophila]SEG11848.1 flagellar hook-associated protein 1 FlgK [Jhaorihella thermophila]